MTAIHTWGVLADGRRIGLLGGSFNPAHDGHLHVSQLALRAIRLDQVWWLVSPQNPLKTAEEMAPLADRLAAARALARDRRVRVTDLEQSLGTRFTADTLRALKSRLPRARFVWIMGADNLAEIQRWANWRRIFETVPVAIFDRPSYSHRALAGQAAQRYANRRLPSEAAGTLAGRMPPIWVFLHSPLAAISATQIRARRRTGVPENATKP